MISCEFSLARPTPRLSENAASLGGEPRIESIRVLHPARFVLAYRCLHRRIPYFRCSSSVEGEEVVARASRLLIRANLRPPPPCSLAGSRAAAPRLGRLAWRRPAGSKATFRHGRCPSFGKRPRPRCLRCRSHGTALHLGVTSQRQCPRSSMEQEIVQPEVKPLG
jgi:hypothetical protein